jgi:sporulation protein YlmC with PRC-barrel domain
MPKKTSGMRTSGMEFAHHMSVYRRGRETIGRPARITAWNEGSLSRSVKEKQMKWTRNLMAILSIVGLLLAATSFAQQREGVPGGSPGVSPSQPSKSAPVVQSNGSQDAPAIPKASTFIGSPVENQQGESLGQIGDLVIDPDAGRITYAALSYGSVLGLGGKLFAVSWEALQLQPDGKTFVLNISKETLENSPGFDKDNWPQQPDPMLSAAAGETNK